MSRPWNISHCAFLYEKHVAFDKVWQNLDGREEERTRQDRLMDRTGRQSRESHVEGHIDRKQKM